MIRLCCEIIKNWSRHAPLWLALLAGPIFLHGQAPRSFVENRIEELADQIDDPVLAAEWDRMTESRQRYLQSLHRAQTLLRTQSEFALSSALTRRGLDSKLYRLDPWAGLDQETDFFPPIRKAYFPSGHATARTGGTAVLRQFPDRYRLAELLKLGTNSLRLEVSFLDPELHSSFPHGRSVVCRVRNDLVGVFTLNPTNTIELFRFTLESHSRFSAYSLNLGQDVKPHHFGIIPRDIVEAYVRQISTLRSWEKERMDERILSEGVPAGRSQQQRSRERASEQAAAQAIEDALRELRREIVSRAMKALEASELGRSLDDEAQRLAQWRKARPLDTLSSEGEGRSEGPGFMEKPWTAADFVTWLKAQVDHPVSDPSKLIHEQRICTALWLVEGLAARSSPFTRAAALETCLSLLSQIGPWPGGNE